MSKKAVVEVRENAQKRKNEYFVKGFDITESVEFLLAEVEKDYEFKKQVELQCGLHSCNDILNKQAEKYRKQISDLEAKLAEHNEYFRSFSCENFNEFQDFISTFMLTPHEEQTLIRELKQQLAEKERKIKGLGLYSKNVIDYAIEKLQETKKDLRDKVCLMENDEHCYPQNAIHWQDVVAIIDNQTKKLKEMEL